MYYTLRRLVRFAQVGVNRPLSPLYRLARKHPPIPFLVVCNERTGSNFLLGALSTHPKINHIYEPFSKYNLEKKGEMKKVHQLGAVTYLQHRLKGKGRETHLGFKFLYHQFDKHFAERLTISDMDDVINYITKMTSLKVIHLKRRNKLRLLVSSRLAEKTKKYLIYFSWQRETRARITLTPRECEAFFERVTRSEAYCDMLFANHTTVLNLTYEDLTASFDHETARVMDYLGVTHRNLYPMLTKQTVRPLTDIVTNYDQLKRYFTGSCWESYFDE